MPYQVLKNIVLTVTDLAVILRVFFELLSRDWWQIRFHVPLVCLWILGFFIFPALSCEGRFLSFIARCIARLMQGVLQSLHLCFACLFSFN